jgi:glucan phosphoethanolaminetransferase (alkaline phosphatase superfamily)
VPQRLTNDLKIPEVCGQDGCFDEVMLRELARQLDTLDPQRRARGTVVVLHQMGSHGPAYFKRSPARSNGSSQNAPATRCRTVNLSNWSTPMTTRSSIPTTFWPRQSTG